MLRSNSKKAVENLKQYIIDNFNGSDYSEFAYIQGAKETNARREADSSLLPRIDIFSLIASAINAVFYGEKLEYDLRYKAGRIPRYELFKDWCQDLPSILDCCYYYNRSAVDDLAAILEETAEEATRFSEAEAEERLTALIYREVSKY